MEDSSQRKREMKTKLIEKVSEVISAIESAKHVVEVVCALESLALLLFPLDSSLLSGSVDQRYREQIAVACRSCFLLLACFPFSARLHVYDVFFVDGLATEVVQTLVPCLQQNAIDDHDVNSFHSNTERVPQLVLQENYHSTSFSSRGRDKKLFGNGTLCNRSNTGVISSEITPQVLRHVQSFLSSNFDSSVADLFETDSGSQFWLKMIEAIKDPYAAERLSEQLLHYSSIEHASDVEAYWFFWAIISSGF